jgi:hypothetical protein
MAHWKLGCYHLPPKTRRIPMSIDAYDDILKRAQDELTPEQQQRLSEVLSCHAGRKRGGKQYSITDLEGLGKEIWQGIGADEYVARERDSWDG